MWVKLGTRLPVEDKAGDRPEVDRETGQPRETEYVEYERELGDDGDNIHNYDFDIKDITTQERRLLSFTIENLRQVKTSSVVAGADMESFFQDIIIRYVRGVKHGESGVAIERQEMVDFLTEHFETADVHALLTTVREQMELSAAKKKSWSLRFGSVTPLKKTAQ